MSAPGGNGPGQGEEQNKEQETAVVEDSDLEVMEQEQENPVRALVPADPSARMDWAKAAASEPNHEVIDILRIVLKKTDKAASFFLTDKQKGYLVFKLLSIPKEKVVGIDQEDHRTIRVHMNTVAEPYKVAYSVQVKDGLVTLPMRMFRRLTKVRVMRAGIGTDKEEITNMLEYFGTIEEPVHWCTYFEDHPHPNTLSEEESMMRGIKSGDATVKMYVSKPIPNFALLPNGKKVRVKYNAQPTNCARCHQGIRGCRGNGNAAKCEKAGGKAVPLAEFWKIVTAETEEQRAQRGEGEESSEIPGNVLLVEGLGKEAGIEWLKQFLVSGHTALEARMDTTTVRRSKDKKTWEITGLSPTDIRAVLEGCSGTQYKGRTAYCTPVVASGNSLFELESESGQSENEEDGENKEEGDEANTEEDPLPGATGPGTEKDAEGFEKVETKSAEKKRKKAEKAAKRDEEKRQELEHAKKTGVLDKNGEHKTPPKQAKQTRSSKSKRSAAEASLTPPGAPAPARSRSSRREKTDAQLSPNPTETVTGGQGQTKQ